MAEAQPTTLGQALYHFLTAAMKGMVALTGLEAMSNGIQFVKREDASIVRWGRKRLPRLRRLWDFYGGSAGIGRFVQTSFLFYGGLTTLFLTASAIRFNVFDGTLGRTLVGNLAFIGFGQLPGGQILYWAYQGLAVMMLAGASMTAFQDIQAMTWRNVAIGEIPEVVVHRNAKGTFTRPVTAAVLAAIAIQLMVRGNTGLAVPFYGVGVFLPITAMGLAMRRHAKHSLTGRMRRWAVSFTSMASMLGGLIFVGQVVGKWSEGGWVALLSLGLLIVMAHAILVSPVGFRDAAQIHRIIHEKSQVEGPIGEMVEQQSASMQAYRLKLRAFPTQLLGRLGLRQAIGAKDQAVDPAPEFAKPDRAEPLQAGAILPAYEAATPASELPAPK